MPQPGNSGGVVTAYAEDTPTAATPTEPLPTLPSATDPKTIDFYFEYRGKLYHKDDLLVLPKNTDTQRISIVGVVKNEAGEEQWFTPADMDVAISYGYADRIITLEEVDKDYKWAYNIKFHGVGTTEIRADISNTLGSISVTCNVKVPFDYRDRVSN